MSNWSRKLLSATAIGAAVGVIVGIGIILVTLAVDAIAGTC